MHDAAVIARYLALLTHLGYRPRTIEHRRYALLRAHRIVGEILEATEDDLYRIVSARTMGADARATMITHLKGFYRWALAQELIDSDPSEALRRPRRKRRLPRPMPEPLYRQALATAQEPIRSWLMLAGYAGLRCCEIAPLRGEDRVGDTLLIREQKGGDQGAVAIGPVLADAIGHLPQRGWWFTRWDGVDEPISPGQLQRHANRWLHDSGIDHTMHTLRHRFGSRVYETSGRDLLLTRDLMRHRSVVSTVGYVEIDNARGAEVISRLA